MKKPAQPAASRATRARRLSPRRTPVEVWEESLRQLPGDMDRTALTELLERALLVQAPQVVTRALALIEQERLAPDVAALTRALRACQSTDLVGSLVRALGRTTDSRAEPPLLELLEALTLEPGERARATLVDVLEALERVGTARAAPFLRRFARRYGGAAALREAARDLAQYFEERLTAIEGGALAVVEAGSEGELAVVEPAGQVALVDEET